VHHPFRLRPQMPLPDFVPIRRRTTKRRRLIDAVALACGCALALAAHDPLAAQQAEPGSVVLHVPYPITGPREIQASDRASRSYRAIAARAAPPITDAMAAMVDAALRSGAELNVTRTRRAAPRALAPERAEVDDATHSLGVLILAGDDVLRTSLADATSVTTRFAPTVIEPIADMPYVLVCVTTQCRGLAARAPSERRLSSLRLRSIGTAGELGGSALASHEWIARTRSNPLLVPFAGGNGIVTDLAAERVDAAFLALPLALRHLGHEKLHALGITSARRFESLPELPTLTEAGTPLEFESWFAVFGSTHLPAALTRRIQMAIRAYRTEEAARNELQRVGLVPSSATPAQMARRVETEQIRLNRLGR
jgi:hypothetical protein